MTKKGLDDRISEQEKSAAITRFLDDARAALYRFWHGVHNGALLSLGALSQFRATSETAAAMLNHAAPHVRRELEVRLLLGHRVPRRLTCWQVLEQVDTSQTVVRINDQVRGRPWLRYKNLQVVLGFDLPPDERNTYGGVTALLGADGRLVFSHWTPFLLRQPDRVMQMFRSATPRSSPRRSKVERLFEEAGLAADYQHAVIAAFFEATEAEPNPNRWPTFILGTLEAEVGVRIERPQAREHRIDPISSLDESRLPPAPDDPAEAVQRRQDLNTFVASLPDAERDAVLNAIRAGEEQVKLSEFCRREGQPYGATRKALSRARRRYRSQELA